MQHTASCIWARALCHAIKDSDRGGVLISSLVQTQQRTEESVCCCGGNPRHHSGHVDLFTSPCLVYTGTVCIFMCVSVYCLFGRLVWFYFEMFYLHPAPLYSFQLCPSYSLTVSLYHIRYTTDKMMPVKYLLYIQPLHQFWATMCFYGLYEWAWDCKVYFKRINPQKNKNWSCCTTRRAFMYLNTYI